MSETCLRLRGGALPVLVTAPSEGVRSPLLRVESMNYGKSSGSIAFHMDFSTFKSSVISTVLGKRGNHGADSELHRYTLDDRQEPKRSMRKKIVIDFRWVSE